MKDSQGQILETNTSGQTREKAIASDLEKQLQELVKNNLQLQTALTDSDDRYNQLIENLPAALYTCDKDGRITLFNTAAVDLWGRTPEIGKDQWCGSWKIYNPDGSELPLGECPMATALKEGRTVYGQEIIVEKPNGDRRYVLPHPRPVFDRSGNVSGAVNMLIDITDVKIARKNFQESEAFRSKSNELKKSEDQYHRMIAEIQDYVIILLDPEGNIQNWNKGAESIKGYSAQEAIGKNFSMFYSEDDRKRGLPQQLIQIARSQGKADHEGWRIRKDGTKFWGSIVITAIHDDNDNIVGYSKVTRDLTERKKADELLRSNAEKMREKNRELEAMNQELASFAYVSSHDLQEPLRKIQTFSSRIVEMEEDNLSPKGKDYFQRMQNAALRMQTLIEDLLAYSRTNTSEQKFERSDLNKLLEDVKNELKETIEEKKVQIKADKLPTLDVISFQIRQLFTNILSNAIKFSKDGIPPVIRISVEKVNAPADIEHVRPDTSYFHISFTDNGIGFDPEHKHKIFEVFQRLHGRSEYTGTGIGLAICKKIMDNHHGFISADSESEKGATFHVYLPEEKAE